MASRPARPGGSLTVDVTRQFVERLQLDELRIDARVHCIREEVDDCRKDRPAGPDHPADARRERRRSTQRLSESVDH